jgi:hypothetical protein
VAVSASASSLSREVQGDERALWWERAVEAYPSYGDYQVKTSRIIPVFVATRLTHRVSTGPRAPIYGGTGPDLLAAAAMTTLQDSIQSRPVRLAAAAAAERVARGS